MTWTICVLIREQLKGGEVNIWNINDIFIIDSMKAIKSRQFAKI